eukprot:5128517-Pleurochrysis_carterae.AAC.2
MDGRVRDSVYNLRSAVALSSNIGEGVEPNDTATAHRPDITRALSRSESVDARMDSPKITLRSGGRRVLQDISAERALKSVFENGGVVWKVSIAVGDVNALTLSGVKVVLVVSDGACLRLEANWA